MLDNRQHYETIYGGRDLSSSNPILYRAEREKLVKLQFFNQLAPVH